MTLVLLLLVTAFPPHGFIFEGGSDRSLPVKNLDSGRSFNTIQEAIDDYYTDPGHRIYVTSGTYD